MYVALCKIPLVWKRVKVNITYSEFIGPEMEDVMNIFLFCTITYILSTYYFYF